MIAGNSHRDFIKDLLYNASPEALLKIQNGLAKIKHERENETKDVNRVRKLSMMETLLGQEALVNLYNAMRDGKLNDGFTTEQLGRADQKFVVEAKKDIDALARIFADKEMDVFDKMGAAMEMYTRSFGEATEKEKQQQSQAMAKVRQTCEDENIKYNAPISPDKEVQPKFKELYDWLKRFETTTSKKKAFKQMEKMSDVQKVSAVEFAKPRALFMKKLVGREFWFRGEKPEDRYLHCITDFSGSMGEFMGERNTTWQMLFDTCQKAGIEIENTMFNCGLENNKPVKWTDQEVLNKCFKFQPDGGDDLGRATIDKLRLLTRKKEKQYLVAISDGTGSFRNEDTAELAKQLALEKNVELKFVLFSKENSMYTIDTKDIFYIFNGNEKENQIKKGSGILETVLS